jgi:predicted HTH transcriptional regulator
VLAIDEVMMFVKKHAMHGVEVPGSRYGGGIASGAGFANGAGWGDGSLSKHRETWSLPLTAIREAVINAVVHADYAQQGAPIRLAIFDNRIEIENPGLLLFGLTIDEIKSGISKLRNRVIGQVFYRLGLIERWGSGIKRIIDTCHEAGFAEPLFEEIGTHFRVTIFTQIVKNPLLNQTDQAIIAILKKTDGLSTKEIAAAIKKSQRITRTRLVTLIEKGLVAEVGQGINDPKRKYFLKNE